MWLTVSVCCQKWPCLCPHTQFLTISQQHNFSPRPPPTKTNHKEWLGQTEGGFTNLGKDSMAEEGRTPGKPSVGRRCQEALLRVESIPSPSQMARLPLLSFSLLLQPLQPWLGFSFLRNTNRQQRKCRLPLSLFQANPKSSCPGARRGDVCSPCPALVPHPQSSAFFLCALLIGNNDKR